MKRWTDVEAMIFEPAIDRRTEEKMLRGTLPPEDAPPEFAQVALLMRAASAARAGGAPGSSIPEADRLRRDQVVASMVAVIAASGPEAGLHAGTATPTLWKARQPSTERTGKLRAGALGRARLVLIMALGLMLASAGLAFAGVLPAPIQHAASVVLSKVGVHVPGQTHDGNTPPAGHEPTSGPSTGGDNGNGKDNGNHTGQIKNGDKGKHNGQEKSGNQRHHYGVGTGGSGNSGSGQGGSGQGGSGQGGSGGGSVGSDSGQGSDSGDGGSSGGHGH
jgi:hypothetical protein